jgi:predicted phage terminase large subunit-like protein
VGVLSRAADQIEADLESDERPAYPTPGALAAALYPRVTIQTPALQLLDEQLVEVAEARVDRLMWFMPPQEGKSQRVSRWFPLWMLLRNPDLRIAIASYELGTARRWGRAIRNEIKAHPDLGLKVKADTAAAHEWELDGHTGGVYCAGVGGALTGRPVDLMIIDDPVKGRAEADSETYREDAKEWWRETVNARLGEHTPVVVVMTRWHEDDLAGWLLAEYPEDWHVVNIPALADHDPAKGELDPLGREPGEWLESARGRSTAGWEKRRKNFGARGFTALCQGRPAPAEGGLLKRAWWRYDDAPAAYAKADGTMVAHAMDTVIQSWDMTFKDTDASDYVVGQVWARRGAEVFLLDQVRDRMDFPTTCRAVQALSAKWPQAALKLVEDKANGPAVIAQLRQKVPGMVPINPKDSKAARVAAVSPFIEAGNVHLPAAARAPWILDFVEECAGFPTAAHDDQVDTMTQAITRLLLDGSATGFLDQLLNHQAS